MYVSQGVEPFEVSSLDWKEGVDTSILQDKHNNKQNIFLLETMLELRTAVTLSKTENYKYLINLNKNLNWLQSLIGLALVKK